MLCRLTINSHAKIRYGLIFVISICRCVDLNAMASSVLIFQWCSFVFALLASMDLNLAFN